MGDVIPFDPARMICGGCGHRYTRDELHSIGYGRLRCQLCWSRQASPQ